MKKGGTSLGADLSSDMVNSSLTDRLLFHATRQVSRSEGGQVGPGPKLQGPLSLERLVPRDNGSSKKRTGGTLDYYYRRMNPYTLRSPYLRFLVQFI